MIAMVRRAEVAIVVCALFGWTAIASAAGEREKKKAKTHAKNAIELFEAKSYELALVEFQKAYDLYPAAGLLYNMGQCHLFLRDWEQAIERFESFLAKKPDTPYRADIERLIGEARAELEKQNRETQPEPRPPPLVEDKPPVAPPPPEVVAPPPPPPVEEESDPVYTQWWFWTILGGVAIAAGGTAIAVAATSRDTISVLPMGDLGLIDRR